MRKRLLSLLLVFVLVLGMLPASAYAADIPAKTNILDITSVTEFIPGEEIAFSLWGMPCGPVPSYIATVPKGTKTVTLTFKSDTYPTPYNDYITGELSLSGAWVTYNEEDDAYSSTSASHYPTAVGNTYSIELNVANMITNGQYYCAYNTANSPIYLLTFEYAEDGDSGEDTPTTSDVPFLSIKIGDEEVAAENIVLKNPAFQMGDIGDGDGWDLIHEAPYYVVTVPCGTTTVDVTYPGEPVLAYNTENNKAHGYATVIDGVDAVSGATVKGKNNFADYTKNSDNTQTVAMPVTGYALDENGEGMAITLEDGSTYAAICFFSFKYDGEKHVYDAGKVTTEPGCESEGVKTFTCSCGESYTEPIDATGHSYADGVCANCGEADPDYVAPGVDIPTSATFTALTADATGEIKIAEQKTVSFNSWGSSYSAIHYHVTVPEGTTTVFVTYPAGTSIDMNGGGGYSYDVNMEDSSAGGGGPFKLETQTDGSIVVAIPIAEYCGTGVGVALEDAKTYAPFNILTFAYPEGAHEHSYTEEITTPATCTTPGVKTFTCSCSDSYTEEIPAIGHKWNDGEQTKDPTCNDAGEKTYTCQNDGSHTKTEAVAKLGHKYDDGVVDPAPTCTAAGTKTYTCTVCAEGTVGHTKTETVKALGHNYANGKCQNEGCEETCPLQDENGVFLLASDADLLWFANAVNGGLKDIDGKLTADITLPENWPGIGNSTNKFAGTFDGDGHTVTLSGSTWGLFVHVMGTYNSNYSAKEYAVVKNVITDGISKDAPLIHAAGYAKITNCINKADTTGTNGYIAGIVGSLNYATYMGNKKNDIRIENCINEGDIAGTMNVAGILGEGLAGFAVTGCVNTGEITGSGAAVGGIAGYLQSGTITNCYNKGAVSGGKRAGGIVGDAYSGVTISNCYNAGETTYAVVGNVYTGGSASNVYYRADKSDYDAPERRKNSYDSPNGYNTTHHGTAMNSADMGSAGFAATLGDAFKASCGGPVLTWQNTVEHSISENQVCTVCHYGLTEATTLKVHKSTGDGYEINGYDTVAKGNTYTFTVDIQDGYEAPDLKVDYNGTALTANEDGKYTITPTGHFYLTVTGVKEMPNVRPIALPKEGDGYRVNPCDGYTTTVANGSDFKFTVKIVEGFKKGENFQVKVNGSAVITPDANDVYTISDIQEKKTITVDGVVTASTDSVTIDVHITDGTDAFFEAKNFNKTLMINQQVTIPYFDLELYGMQKYYYNPYCYVDANGNPVTQTAGSREDANGVVTVMHAFIYMTDMFYLGLDEEHAGTGYSDRMDTDGDGISDFDEAIYWGEQPVGSTFVNNFWGHPNGGNLNYHVNYTYPLGREDWGSTSDQIRMYSNDVLTIHFIGGGANGSAFGFFAADDTDNTYNGNEQKDYATVKAGDTITLTNYIGSQGPKYTTAFITGTNKELYWVEAGAESAVVAVGEDGNWSREGFGNMTAEQFKTDENGVVTLDTTGMEPGTYYIANHGQFYKGNGTADSAGFVSNGAEAGPSYFVLTITEGDAGTQTVYGDADGDGEIKAADALLIKQFVAEMEVTLNEDAADVDHNGVVQAADALLIEQFVAEIITEFPVE